MKSILIADDHTMFINGLKLLLSTASNYRVVATAHNGQEVLDLLEHESVDILLLDVNMPILNGYQTTLQVSKRHPDVKIIILSMLADELSVNKLIDAGAKGYLFKNADEEELYEALDTVLEDRFYITKEIREKIHISAGSNRADKNKLPNLSSREVDIVKLVVEGYTNTEIADKLFLSVRTVDTHRKNILAKLRLNNTASLVRYVIENKVFFGL
ncbi:response regulator [Olivibacter sitiensis]|uniref:response regulator n=1 Tax=Olivibacter sitiensis TaxID=376470 RepID=UPI000488A184|nr:response regulator transcription factor [Olivibacter sitiensis]